MLNTSHIAALATLVAMRPPATAADVIRAQETRPRRLVIRCASTHCGVLCAESGLGEEAARAAAVRNGFRPAPGQPEKLLFCSKCARKRGYKPSR